MPEQKSDGVNRRAMLRKTAATGAAMVGGAATISGSASAFPFEVGDRVQVSKYSAVTYLHCCPDDPNCDRASRDEGDAGQIIGECDFPYPYTGYQISWDTKGPDQYYMSWISNSDIEEE